MLFTGPETSTISPIAVYAAFGTGVAVLLMSTIGFYAVSQEGRKKMAAFSLLQFVLLAASLCSSRAWPHARLANRRFG
jgi:hypothetical protein